MNVKFDEPSSFKYMFHSKIMSENWCMHIFINIKFYLGSIANQSILELPRLKRYEFEWVVIRTHGSWQEFSHLFAIDSRSDWIWFDSYSRCYIEIMWSV